jgi:putative ABC transport system permease protein
MDKALAGAPIASRTTVSHVPVVVGGQSSAGIALEPTGPYPSIVSGRPASGTGEVVLGSVLARDLHVGVGDRVSLATDGGAGDATVVGLAVFPRFAAYDGAEKTGLGEGVAMTPAEAESLGAQVDPALELLQLARGTDVDAATRDLDARLTSAARDLGLPIEAGNASSWKITRPPEPDGLTGYRDLGSLPIIFAGLLALVTGGATAHVLISSVRQRRTELGVLRAFGFDRRQVRRSIAWQASATALVALVVGIPLGIVVGRAGWHVFADRIGVVPSVAMPVWLVAVVPVVLGLANAVALLPARRATRAPAALALRTE